MMNHSMKNPFNFKPGTVIEGKWHKNVYTIIKELGYGANGVVYLAKWRNQDVAIKLSTSGTSITSEVNVLKSFAKVQGSVLGPSLLDVDDWGLKSGTVFFYVMEYIKGPDFMTFIEQKGSSWLPVLTLQLLTDLERLHQNGWVFGDLKPENLIVTGPPAKIRCIDVGGTTMIGRAIKEFTEFYDRGYWGLGSRKADPAYDLFSLAMVMTNTAYPKQFNKTTGGLVELVGKVKQSPTLQKVEFVIIHALQGDYQSANQMRNDLLRAMSKSQSDTHHVSRQTRSVNTSSRSQAIQRKRKKGGWTETALLVTLVLLFYVIYIYSQLV